MFGYPTEKAMYEAAALGDGSAETVLSGTKVRSRTLLLRKFGFNVPAGARILGVEMTITRASVAGIARDAEINLYSNGKALGDRGTATPWPSGKFETMTLGGATDSWLDRCSNCAGLTALTPAMLNDEQMGLGISASIPAASAGDTARVESVSAKVYYCE
jgi:hypothetical protein